MKILTLKALNLQKSYKSRRVVNGISIEINNQEIVGLLGPNGAGKTTSFYMIVGLVSPDNGQVLLGEEDISQLPLHARARLGIGYLPQETSIFRKLTVAENIMAILETREDLNKKERMQKLNNLLEKFNIKHLAKLDGVSLSGGETRRVEIARTLATDPKFILLDEPFAGIDPISVTDIKQIIQQLHQSGIGILITDHNVRETLDICQRAYIVNQGKILTEGTPQEILAHKEVREVYLGDEF